MSGEVDGPGDETPALAGRRAGRRRGVLPAAAAGRRRFSLRAPGGGYGRRELARDRGRPGAPRGAQDSLQIAVITAVRRAGARRADGRVGAGCRSRACGRCAGERDDPADRGPARGDGGGHRVRAGEPRRPRLPRPVRVVDRAALTPFYVSSRCRSPTAQWTTGSPPIAAADARGGGPQTWVRAWPRRCCGSCCPRSAARCWARLPHAGAGARRVRRSPGSCCTPTRSRSRSSRSGGAGRASRWRCRWRACWSPGCCCSPCRWPGRVGRGGRSS